MNTAKTTFLRARASFLAAGLASLLGGCVIEAKIGDDPEAGSDTGDATESAESSTTYSPGYTSGAEPGTASASTTTGANPGSVSVTSGADEDEAGDDEGPSETTGGLDQDAALELCGVEVMPPVPGGPHHTAGLMCDGGCFVEVESSVELDLFGVHGECLCEALGCGPAVGGSTSTSDAPGDTETDGGDPDGCGVPFGGDESFICGCEACSVSVNSVDETWLDDQDDLSETCECLCGVAGCGMPT